ncbi:MAG: NAD-dependent epimerase/dehydratase family protein [Halobacteriales archaeon]
MDRVLVTGGFGRVGPWVIEQFLNEGYEVACVDQQAPETSIPGVSFFEADLTEQGAAWEILFEYDPDAIVHLASVARAASEQHGTAVFSANARMTYHLLVAAGHADVPVVWTSSETVYGPMHSDGEWQVDRLPVDESSPTRPTGAYPTSKLTGEVIAGAVAREFDLSIASVRPSWVVRPIDAAGIPGPTYAELSDLRESFDPESVTSTWNLWSYVDVRDLGRLLLAVIAGEFEGHELFLGVADENYLDRSTAEAAQAIGESFPSECSLSGDQSAQSNAKAERVLGWTPSHSWKSATPTDVSTPSVLEAVR